MNMKTVGSKRVQAQSVPFYRHSLKFRIFARFKDAPEMQRMEHEALTAISQKQLSNIIVSVL